MDRIIFSLLTLCALVVSQDVRIRRQSDPDDPPVLESFFETPAFARIVLNITETSQDPDRACKASRGIFWFHSDTTSDCNNCATECAASNITEYCASKCESFLVYQRLESMVQASQKEVENMKQQNEAIESKLAEHTVGFAVGIVLAFVVCIICIVVAGVFLKRRIPKLPESDGGVSLLEQRVESLEARLHGRVEGDVHTESRQPTNVEVDVNQPRDESNPLMVENGANCARN